MSMMLELLVIPAFILINRLRGSAPFKFVKFIGGRMLFLATIIAFTFLFLLQLFLTLNPLNSFVFALSWSTIFLLWGTLGWGRWFDLGKLPENYNRLSPPNKPKIDYIWKIPYVKIDPDWIFELPANFMKIERGENFDFISLLFRMLILVPIVSVGVLFGILNILLIPISVIASILMTYSYKFAWYLKEKHNKEDPIVLAEYLVGLVWGHMILISIFLV